MTESPAPARHPIVPMEVDPVPETGQLGVAVLGSTGSIGRQTLDVIDRHPDRFRVVILAAGTPSALLKEQIARYRPALVAVDADAGKLVADNVRVLQGQEGLIEAATHPEADIVMVATSGHAAILPTARAIEAHKIIALANKESIVCAGDAISSLCRKHEGRIRPVDSEHSAIWQSLGRSSRSEIDRLVLTASGGPFREHTIDELRGVTIEAALNHPTWAMGAKITVDSATLMNKGLELIEAHVLFGVPYERIEVVVHPESIVHSLVGFRDGGQIAQLSFPDMRLPIQYALTYPTHAPSGCRPLDLTEVGTLRFLPPDAKRFSALRLAREAGIAGRSFPTVLSAADEVAVRAFSEGKIGFLDISALVERVLAAHEGWAVDDLEAVAAADTWATRVATELIAAR